MRLFSFDRDQDIPIVDALVVGPRSRERVKLVFDSGCGTTQIHTGVMESIGYSARLSSRTMIVKGPVGEGVEGYIINLEKFNLFGHSVTGLEVGVYDFDNFAHYGIDGLLGFDLIKQMHFELNGPKGLLKIFDISD